MASQMGYEITSLIAGSVVIEKILVIRESENYLLIPSANGLYRDHILSIDFRNRDASGTLLSDIIMSIVDPRIRIQ